MMVNSNYMAFADDAIHSTQQMTIEQLKPSKREQGLASHSFHVDGSYHM